jgi:hypothetical protein
MKTAYEQYALELTLPLIGGRKVKRFRGLVRTPEIAP